VRDLVIHGDDLVVATHGRSFRILHNVTPLRQATDVRQAGVWLYRPATAVRIDNAAFIGTPLPPEEPTTDNPPDGAVIDYFLAHPAGRVKLEIFDSQHQLVRSFSSDVAGQAKHPPLPIAERWLPQPQILQKFAGMHRFVWNLAWGAELADAGDEQDYAAPHGPRAAPGDYEIRLTIDGKTLTHKLHLTMDPRSTATPQDLARQVKLGRQIFTEALNARKALSAIQRVQKQLSDLQPKLQDDPGLKASADVASDELKTILSGASSRNMGLENANSGLSAALRVVESSDRSVPSQALQVYRQSRVAASLALAKWNDFTSTRLPELNHQLEGAGLPRIAQAQLNTPIQ
jgi:hypothetical protein